MTPELEQLVRLSGRLGEYERHQVILGEGNASAKQDEETFWVKASGKSLEGIGETGFVQVNFAPILAAYDADGLSDQAVRETLLASRVNQQNPAMPSVETFFHAWLLSLPEIRFIGHTHARSVLALMCLEDAAELSQVRLFPDEVVCCGPATAVVPYVDPGLPLSIAIRDSVLAYADRQGALPKIVVMQNHGVIALGKSPNEVESGLFMAEKSAWIKLQVLQSQRPMTTMTQAQIERIATRPDEHYRQRLIWQLRGGST